MAAAMLLVAPIAALGGERELWSLWQKHLTAPDDHAAVVSACRAYAAAAEDPFLPVVQGIEAWHLLRADQTAEAVRRFAPHLKDGDDAVAMAAQRLARAWITRLQRERVVDALQAYYRQEVRYPPDLETLVAYPDLPDAGKVPMQDAWKKAWRYRLVGFEAVPGFRDQKYELESSSIQPPWDPVGALALPYSDQIVAKAVRLPQNVQGTPVVKLEYQNQQKKTESTVSQVGSTVDGLTIAYAGKQLVILCDTLHWKVLPWSQK